MAIQPLFSYTDLGLLVVYWTLANGDTGAPVESWAFSDKTVQIYGTFGSGGTIQLEGANAVITPGTTGVPSSPTWGVLRDPLENNLITTGPLIKAVLENPFQIRPNCTVGDGTTSLVVLLCMRISGGRVQSRWN